MNCLTDQQLNRLFQGLADSNERLQAMLHLEDCESCRSRFAQSAKFSSAAADIADNVLETADCPDYAVLSDHLDGVLNPAASKWLSAHINSCELCYKDIQQIKMLRDRAAMREPVTLSPEKATRHVSGGWKWIFGTAAGAVAVALVLGVFTNPQQAPDKVMVAGSTPPKHQVQLPVVPIVPEITNQPVKPVVVANKPEVVAPVVKANTPRPKPAVVAENKPEVVLSDGAVQIVRNRGKMEVKIGAKGSVEKLIASYIDQKLRTGKVKATEPVQLAMNSIVVRSTPASTDAALAPKPQSPVGKVIISAQPLLEWKSVDMAQDYQVTVTDKEGRVVYETVTPKSRVKIDLPLDRGQVYAWRVASRFSDDNEWQSSSAAAFKIISQDDLKLLETARKQTKGSKLAMGTVYESLQLHEEAQREYKNLSKSARGIDMLRSLNGK